MSLSANTSPSQRSFADLFEKHSGLSEWWFWVVILGAICLVIALLWKFSPSPTVANELVGNGLYVLLFSIGIGCFYKSFDAMRFLSRETRLASEQVAILERVSTFEDFFCEAKESVFKLHIENLHTMASAHPDVDQDNLIEILHNRLLSRNRVVELFSGVLVTIGLIGTIIGLIFMMDGLSEIIQKSGVGSNLVSVLFAKNGPMGALGLAFYTTLVGATLGGVIFRVLTSIVDENVTRYVSHVAELTAVHVIPVMKSRALKTISAQYSREAGQS